MPTHTIKSQTDSSYTEAPSLPGSASDTSIGAGDSNSLKNTKNNCDNNGRCTANSPSSSNSQHIQKLAVAPEPVRVVDSREDDTIQLAAAEPIETAFLVSDEGDGGDVESGLFLGKVLNSGHGASVLFVMSIIFKEMGFVTITSCNICFG